MNLFEKLNEMRIHIAQFQVKKSGNNNGRRYFELSDFLPVILDQCQRHKVTPVIQFDSQIAKLTLHDAESESSLVFTSPFGSAALKGCHEVQNIGAVETYQRRYLYMVAFEIVEADAIDSTEYYNQPTDLGAILDTAIADNLMTPDQADTTMAKYNELEPSKRQNYINAVEARIGKLRYESQAGK